MKTVRPNSHRAYPRRGFALVITLVMVALLAIITIGVFTSVSLERVTAKSYNDRYQAELAAQNAMQAAAKTLAATPDGTNSITGKDTFLVVRADSGQGTPAYYYLAQPSTGSSPTITYYPLFSSSADPNAPVVQTQPINLAAPFAPAVPAPAPPADSSPSDPTAAWDAAKAQRVPKLYSWQ
jgi:type II secretory pathway pseudopilin PulG